MLLCNETGMFLGGVQQLFRLMWCFSNIKLENKFRAKTKGNKIPPKEIGIYHFQNTISFRFRKSK